MNQAKLPRWKRLAALAAALTVGLSAAQSGVPLLSLAQSAPDEAAESRVVWQQVSEDREGFAVSVNGAAEGSGVTLTQEAVPFAYEYLALDMTVSYVSDAAGDEYFPVKFFINGNLLEGTPETGSEAYIFKAYDREERAFDVEQKYGGYIFLTPGFDGTLYVPKTLLKGAAEITGLRVSCDGAHDGELALLNVYGCAEPGDKLGAPVVNENNLTATTDEGIALSDGFAVEKTGSTEGNGIHILQDAVPFASKYLGIDLTVEEAYPENDAHIFIKLAVEGVTLTPESGTQFPVSCRDDETRATVQNLFGGWFLFPRGFDGMVYIDAQTYLGGVDSISRLDILFDGGHTGKLKINNFFGCEEIGSSFNPMRGILFSAGENASLTPDTAENTAGDTYVTLARKPALPVANEQYLAVRIRMLACSVTEDYTYIRFAVNGNVLQGDSGNAGEITSALISAYPTAGEPMKLEQKWGNWIVIPSEFDGVVYLPIEKYCKDVGAISSFSFLFDAGHTNRFEYAVGVANTLGGAAEYIDTAAAAEIVKTVARLENFQTESTDTASVFDLTSFQTDAEGGIADEAVRCDPGVRAFDSYSYSYAKFGGVEVNESWENQLVVHIRSQFEGGKPLNAADNKDPYGYLEFSAGEAFTLGTGLTVNAQCLSAECYFRVLLIDENGGVWSADYAKTDYTFVSDGAPVGIATLYNNFYYGEDSYGTLYIPKEYFVPVDNYQGEAVSVASEMGKIEKVVLSFDMQYGLGRTMSVGKICNADIAGETVETLFDPSSMTNEQLGIGTAKGTATACTGSEAHVANFLLRRELLEETPGYTEPDPPPPDSSSSSGTGGNSQEQSSPGTDAGCKGCNSATGFASVIGAAALGITLTLRKKSRGPGGKKC